MNLDCADRFCIMVLGPTGVGKSDFALQLSYKVPAEIINCDVCQFYQPLTIGTAKPDWKVHGTPHHGYDLLTQPVQYDVVRYREYLLSIMNEIWSRGKIPILVGGSLFYSYSLLFPPGSSLSGRVYAADQKTTYELWQELHVRDEKRALAIHLHDRYRIVRALSILDGTGIKPSDIRPAFSPPFRSLILFLDRERSDLYDRINKRVVTMFQEGWLDEVQALTEPWRIFLKTKKCIGYPEIIDFLEQKQQENMQENEYAYSQLMARIQRKTRNYAKRQLTYWRMLKRQLTQAQAGLGVQPIEIQELNLTFLDVALYIRQLSDKLMHNVRCSL